MRGSGWVSNFSIGNVVPQAGVPLVSVLRWDTGVQVHAASDLAEATASVTAGGPPRPHPDKRNGGEQIAPRPPAGPPWGLAPGGAGAPAPVLRGQGPPPAPRHAPARRI